MCAARVSRPLIDDVRDLVRDAHRGREVEGPLFLEYLFHTIALHRSRLVAEPAELSEIVWRRTWEESQLRRHRVYHPVKDIASHGHLVRRTQEAHERPLVPGLQNPLTRLLDWRDCARSAAPSALGASSEHGRHHQHCP